jgi:hypothetical protein
VKFDPEDLTLDEVEEVETILGGSIDSVLAGGQPKGRALKAIVYIFKRREDPAVTMESVGSVKLSELNLGEAEAVS